MKRLLSVLLVLAMLMSLASVSAVAEEIRRRAVGGRVVKLQQPERTLVPFQ